MAWAYWVPTAVLVGTILGVAVLHVVLFILLKRLAKVTDHWQLDDDLVHYLKWPLLPVVEALVGLLLIALYLHNQYPQDTVDSLIHAYIIVLIAGTGWCAIGLSSVVERYLLRSHHYRDLSVPDNRAMKTQVTILRRLFVILITVVTLAICLLTFDAVRTVGVGLLLSAGLLALCLGVSAAPFVSTLYASLQLALAQPIRVGDVVVFAGEWGKIEEIHTTFVVVAIWDQRRLIVPVQQFLTTTFANWSRTSEDLLGSIFVYVDYTVNVEAVRRELELIVAAAPLWDKRCAVLQVTDWKDNVVELRLLVSARNSSDTWDLRCLVRERILAFLKREYPKCLPQIRAQCLVDTAATQLHGHKPKLKASRPIEV